MITFLFTNVFSSNFCYHNIAYQRTLLSCYYFDMTIHTHIHNVHANFLCG